MILSLSVPVSEIGFRVSVNGSSNANFNATVIASGLNRVLGTYSTQDVGGGMCPALFSQRPTACRIGFVGVNLANITKISIEAFGPVTDHDVAFVIDTL